MKGLNAMGKLDMFGNTKFTLYEISEFIEARKLPFSFATVTSRENAAFSIAEKNFFFCFENYYGDNYNNIIKQASEWIIKVVRTEEWDPSIYGNKGKTTTEYYQEIDAQLILVKDNSFAGLINYNSSFDLYQIFYGLVEDYKNEPVLCWCNNGFGSSDHDMMYTEKYYLMKKGS